jgi:hypothetical protein
MRMAVRGSSAPSAMSANAAKSFRTLVDKALQEKLPSHVARRNHGFRNMLGWSAVSMLGSQITAVAFPLLILSLTGSPDVAGWATLAATLPSIPVCLPAGMLVDRWNPRRVVLVFGIGRCLAIATIVAELLLDAASVLSLILIVSIEQIGEVFIRLAEQRLADSLVRPDQETAAVATKETGDRIIDLTARPLGELLFAFGRPLPFIADAFTSIVSLGAVSRVGGSELRLSGQERRLHRRASVDLSAGLRWVNFDPYSRSAFQ